MDLPRVTNASVSELSDPTKLVLHLECSDGTAKDMLLSQSDIGKLVTVLLRRAHSAGQNLERPAPVTDPTVFLNPIPTERLLLQHPSWETRPNFLCIDMGLTQLVFQLPEPEAPRA